MNYFANVIAFPLYCLYRLVLGPNMKENLSEFSPHLSFGNITVCAILYSAALLFLVSLVQL